jgi:hypothetical protein
MIMEPIVRHLRRYCTEYVGRQNTDALDALLGDEYVLTIGGTDLVGRDGFKAAAKDVFVQFPTIDVGMHEIVVSGDRVAARFTERSSWSGHPGRSAIWEVITLFRWNGDRFTSCLVEQDFYGRREQLRSGEPRQSLMPGADPWAAETVPVGAGVEEAVRAWLTAADVAPDEAAPRFEVSVTQVDELFGSGAVMAFHVTQEGTYAGGFDVPAGAPAVRHVAGLVTVDGGAVTSVRSVSDRLELESRLRP